MRIREEYKRSMEYDCLPTYWPTITETLAATLEDSRRLRDKIRRMEHWNAELVRCHNAQVIENIHRLRAFVFNGYGETKCPSCGQNHHYTRRLVANGTFTCYGCGYTGVAISS